MKLRRPQPESAKPADTAGEDEHALFLEAIGRVRRIEVEEAAPGAPKPAPRPRQREADERQAVRDFQSNPFEFGADTLGDGLEYLAEGLAPRILRRLKRGLFAVQDEIDLHRMSAALAEDSIRVFLHEAETRGLRCVRIVHGKGLRSKDATPVLKQLTDRLLRQRADVLAFASARPGEGGTGAVVVLLKRRRAGFAHDIDQD